MKIKIRTVHIFGLNALAIFIILFFAIQRVTGFHGRDIAFMVFLDALCLFITVLLWSRQRHLRIKLLIIAVAYICNTIMFASIHYVWFLTHPTHYAFSSSIKEGKVNEEFRSTYKSLLDTSNRLYLLGILYAHADPAFRALTEGRKRTYNFGDGRTARVTVHVISGNFQGPPNTIFEFEIEDSQRIYHFPTTPDEESRAVHELTKAQDLETFRLALLQIIAVMEHRQDEILEVLNSQITGNPRDWDLLDFFYFSTVTVTTLGYGDILPNSQMVRVLVMFQAFIGIFFLAFALSFLRPKTRQLA
ncbi:MAG: potassium channel family protein [candidate division Zixibacteria bacterium]|nr:potassium channel family protein [candidate division Zixibacteria bacterium]